MINLEKPGLLQIRYLFPTQVQPSTKTTDFEVPFVHRQLHNRNQSFTFFALEDLMDKMETPTFCMSREMMHLE
jgi:hypothetical protein